MVLNPSGMLYRQYIKERSNRTTSKKEFNAGLKKAKDWDGISRPSNDAYTESWNRIFGGKTEKEEERLEKLKASPVYREYRDRQNARARDRYKARKEEKKTEDRGKGVTICKAKDCNNSLYGWTSSKNKEYCVDCV